MTTLFPLVLDTSTLPVLAKEERLRQLPPAFLLCHKFWLPLTYTIPAVLGSVVIGKSVHRWSLVVPQGGVISWLVGGVKTHGGKSAPSTVETKTLVQGALQ